MRRLNPLHVLTALALVALFASMAGADWSVRPPLTFRHDDLPVSFGNTQAAADAKIRWEASAGAEDFLSVEVSSGAGLLLSSDNNVDRSGSLAAGATFLGVCSDAEASATECLTLSHDGTRSNVDSYSGSINFQPSTGSLQIGAVTAPATGTVSVIATTNSQLRLESSGGGQLVGLLAQQDVDQVLLGTASGVGRQIVITDSGNTTKDHDHAVTTNPTLFIHSATDPDTANTQWMSLTHDVTDGVISTGTGALSLQPAGNLAVMAGTKSDSVVTTKSEIQTTDGAATTCETLTLLDENTYHVESRLIAVETDGSSRASYHIAGTFYRTGAGVATQQGATTVVHSQESDAAFDADFAVSGSTVLVQATGDATPANVEWVCVTDTVNMSN